MKKAYHRILYLGSLLLAGLLLSFSNGTLATEYSAQNPYKPSAQEIRTLQQIIPDFPEAPPMGYHTQFYKEKYVISNHPPGMFKYFVYVPQNYNPETAYPSVLMLHSGARHMYGGSDFFEKELHKKYNAILIVPIVPPGYDWNSGAPLALEALQDVAKNYKLDPNRIYLTGYAMGGIGVYSLLARYPNIFAGAWSACGTYDPKLVNSIDKTVPLLVWHGQKDGTFPVQIIRDIHKRLKSSKHNIAYIEQSDASHADCLKIYEKTGFWKWLFDQKR